MMRQVFSVAAALSLLMCAATVSLWVRSWSVADHLSHIHIDGQGRNIGTDVGICCRGRFFLRFSRLDQPDQSDQPSRNSDPGPNVRLNVQHLTLPAKRAFPMLIQDLSPRLGFGTNRLHVMFKGLTLQPGTLQLVVVPIWPLAVLLSITPITWLVSVWRRRRCQLAGLCADCGYDLTGNTSGTCPECGVAIKSKDVPIKIG